MTEYEKQIDAYYAKLFRKFKAGKMSIETISRLTPKLMQWNEMARETVEV